MVQILCVGGVVDSVCWMSCRFCVSYGKSCRFCVLEELQILCVG